MPSLDLAFLIVIIVLICCLMYSIATDNFGLALNYDHHSGGSLGPTLIAADGRFNETIGRKHKGQFDQSSLTPDEAYDDSAFQKNVARFSMVRSEKPQTLTMYQKYVGPAS